MCHDLIVTDNYNGSCLILIYTACGCCVHVSCHETAKGLAIISSLQNYVYVYEGHYRDFGTYTFKFSSMESEGVSTYAKTRQNQTTSFYKVWMSRREDPSGIFNKFLIETAIDFFLLSLLLFFSAC